MQTIFLKEDEIKEAILKFYSQNQDDNIESSVDRELFMEDGELVCNFYLKDHYKKENRTNYLLLSYTDLIEVFDYYLKDSGYELEGFQYVGGIRHVGYFVDEDTPFFTGIYLQVKEKSLKKKHKLF
jgi:hypothetical protein